MGAYLIDHPPVRDQWYPTRNRPLTGCTVLHTAEGVLDTIGPDTGAEATAEFIRTRTTPGSYHDLVDSDTWVPLIPYEHGAYHDATGSNNWALSISFACRTSDWRAMSPAQRSGFLRQGARAFAAQQAWRKSHGYPTTELRLITKAQSDAGMSGFTYHGLRDPGRRTDPGVAAPDLFPFDEWLSHCRAALNLGGFLMALTDQQQLQMYYALMEANGATGRNNFSWLADVVRAETADIRAMLRGGNDPESGKNNFHWLAEQVVAAVGSIPESQVDVVEAAIAKAVADEIDRRERDRLGAADAS